jgi:uncharacterized protein (DUF2267 family)
MPPPFEYQNASLQFEQFLLDARDFAGLATTNMAWNMVVSVLNTFRRRLSLKQALRFASALPPVVRALFIEDWDIEADSIESWEPEAMVAEVRSIRHEHNFAPSNAIAAVAAALRKHVDPRAFGRALSGLPVEARIYWSAPEPGSAQSKPSAA